MKQCERCFVQFKPSQRFHEMCDECALKTFRAAQGRCSDCGFVRGGLSDNYFLHKCSCNEYRELNEEYDDYD